MKDDPITRRQRDFLTSLWTRQGSRLRTFAGSRA